MPIFKVILPVKLDKYFFYKGTKDTMPGDIALVPLGNRISTALIWEEVFNIDFPVEKLKEINKTLSPQLYSKNYLEFLTYFTSYNLTTFGQTLRLILPNIKILSHNPKIITYSLGNTNIKTTEKRTLIKEYYTKNNLLEIPESELLAKTQLTKGYLTAQVKSKFLSKNIRNTPITTNKIHYNKPKFSDSQTSIIEEIKGSLLKGTFKTGFLNGVTGSGKTEVYFALIAQLLNNTEKQILVLLPEILLTKQFIDKFHKRFDFSPEIWHSQTSEKDKKRIWHNIVNGNIRFLVGARSALFLPFKNLGLIILDEEHETSYKQEENLIYHARDMAVVRAYKENFPILLVSATPSLETKINVLQGKYKEFILNQRYGVAKLPEISLIDMKKQKTKSNKSISPKLQEEIATCLSKKEQTLIFLNRRGYAPLKICKSCGYRYKCNNCDAWMVEHRKSHELLCHHCGSTRPLVKTCPKCNKEESLISYGFGLERVKEELEEYFPEANIAMITSEESKDFEEVKQIFEDIEANKYDIIIGTQIIGKGHHFANLTLACIIDGDIGSEVQDLRCTEKMFQMLHQISGRVGRAEKKGKAFIQTYNPKSNFLQALVSDNIEAFYEYEINKRQKFLLPPFSQFIALIISDEEQDKAHKIASELTALFKNQKTITTYGPAAAPLFFLRNKYRYRILLKHPKGSNIISKLIRTHLNTITNLKINIKIDVDPQTFI